ncbi:MAG: CHASE3 domain-containing protein [Proteobacteria bacterium]|nr:CHASE3 domain-containing protein [Pseudomonadota bacterium]
MMSVARQVFVIGLMLAAIAGLFIAATSGQRELEEASRRIEQAARRARVLGEDMQLLTQAESGQRGYILLGDPSYLVPYEDAVRKVPSTLERLGAEFTSSDPDVQADVDEITRLTRDKFSEMRETLELYRTRGRGAATALIRSDFGQHTMSQISQRAGRVQAAETFNMLEASQSWHSNRWLRYGIQSAAAAACVMLVFLLRRAVLRYVSSKEREAEELSARQAELESLVKARTEELSELSTHLQSVAEKERAALSRELHDELGGLLVAARMDLSWLEEKVGSSDPDIRAQFKRVQDALQAGVDLKRRVVENLRPTLLDNLGLLPALRWQVADSCGRAGLQCTERYPKEDLRLTPEASIAIFRIVQEALTNILKHAEARNVEVSIETIADWLVIRVRDDGKGLPADSRRALRSHGLAAMRHRANALGGEWRIDRGERGTMVEVRLPIARITVAQAA